MTTAATSLSCPDWCDEHAAHRFDSLSVELGTLVRVHARDLGEFVSISADEHAVTDEGPVWRRDAPRLSVYADGERLTAGQARRLAAELLAGATLLDGLS